MGRFTKIGIPAPEMMAPFVGLFEIGCGALLLRYRINSIWLILAGAVIREAVGLFR